MNDWMKEFIYFLIFIASSVLSIITSISSKPEMLNIIHSFMYSMLFILIYLESSSMFGWNSTFEILHHISLCLVPRDCLDPFHFIIQSNSWIEILFWNREREREKKFFSGLLKPIIFFAYREKKRDFLLILSSLFFFILEKPFSVCMWV